MKWTREDKQNRAVESRQELAKQLILYNLKKIHVMHYTEHKVLNKVLNVRKSTMSDKYDKSVPSVYSEMMILSQLSHFHDNLTNW